MQTIQSLNGLSPKSLNFHRRTARNRALREWGLFLAILAIAASSLALWTAGILAGTVAQSGAEHCQALSLVVLGACFAWIAQRIAGKA